VAELVPRWPLLEHLEFDANPAASYPVLAAQLGRHCLRFASLKTSGAVKPEDAAALARSLARLRLLPGLRELSPPPCPPSWTPPLQARAAVEGGRSTRSKKQDASRP